MRARAFSAVLMAAALLVGALPAHAQVPRGEQFYFPGSFNWSFLKGFPEGARLFNAFDYGHAVLYEVLYARPNASPAVLEEQEFRYLTQDLLRRPPRFAVAEEAVAPQYARLAWHAKQMFERAHVLHRQIYDVYAREGLPDVERQTLVERLTDWYLEDTAYAFVAVPKDMALMDGQAYSQVFKQRYPKFNGLIWAYHWLQVGLYEPLILGETRAEQRAGVQVTLEHFWEMLSDPPTRMPSVMPMGSAVAPTFAARHPRAAIIFDNLHMMHDIISDILTSDLIARDRKGDAIREALAEFRRADRNVMDMEHWRMMGEHMGGVHLMGGSVAALLRR